jgi:hypothetical protein
MGQLRLTLYGIRFILFQRPCYGELSFTDEDVSKLPRGYNDELDIGTTNTENCKK